MKTFILDTNVLLTDPDSLFAFGDNEVILPFTTIEELDKIKSRPNEVGANAREVSRRLSEMIVDHEPGSLKKGLVMRNGGTLRIVAVSDFPLQVRLAGDWDVTNKDNHILDVCRGLSELAKTNNSPAPVLVTRDIVLRVKCDFLGIPCEDYKKSSVAENPDRLYTGVTSVSVPEEVIQSYWESHKEEGGDFNCIVNSYVDHELMPNEFVSFKDTNSTDDPVVRYSGPGEPLRHVKDLKKASIFNVTPRNKEQCLALDLLLDPKIKLVTLVGQAGCGKTLISIAAGLNQVLEKKKYKSLFVCRPVVPVGNDIGWLPGPVPLYTNVLTPDGWKKMGDLKKGSFVIARNGRPTKVSGVFPKGQKEILEITFEDGATVSCCEDHPWAVYKTNDPNRRVLQTKDIEKRQNELGWDKKWWNRLYIDLTEPVEFASQKEPLPIAPYVLGSILGDGCVSQKYANEFSTNDEETVDYINSLLPENIKLKHKSGYSYNFVMNSNVAKTKRENNLFTKAINALGLRGTNSKTKFIPKQYLFASVGERLSLLRGLMDTDGYVSKDGSDVSFTTISKTLAEDVKSLVLSLGGLAKISYYPHKFESYTVSISFGSEEMCPFHLKRKADRWKPRSNRILRRIENVKRTGKFTEMQCISVENSEHLYVMDNFVVTHNTKEEKLEPWIAPIKDNLRFLLFSGKKNRNSEVTLQNYFDDGVIEVEAITYLRGRSIANAFIIIDEAQNLTAHELKTIITRVGENTKIVLTGDIEQIDNIYLDSLSNGLTIAVEKFKEYPISGHVTLVKGERSELATLAAKVL